MFGAHAEIGYEGGWAPWDAAHGTSKSTWSSILLRPLTPKMRHSPSNNTLRPREGGPSSPSPSPLQDSPSSPVPDAFRASIQKKKQSILSIFNHWPTLPFERAPSRGLSQAPMDGFPEPSLHPSYHHPAHWSFRSAAAGSKGERVLGIWNGFHPAPPEFRAAAAASAVHQAPACNAPSVSDRCPTTPESEQDGFAWSRAPSCTSSESWLQEDEAPPPLLASPCLFKGDIDNADHGFENTTAAELRNCATKMPFPFSPEFVLDPPKLKCRTPFFSWRDRLPIPYPSESTPFRVLDLGAPRGDIYFFGLSSAIPGLHMNRASLAPARTSSRLVSLPRFDQTSQSWRPWHQGQTNTNATGPDQERPDVMTCLVSSFRQLPFRNESQDLVTARSLHKGVRRGGSLSSRQLLDTEDLTATLKECYRVLVPGGRFEFIYFEQKLRNAGTLTAELETSLWERHGVPGESGDDSAHGGRQRGHESEGKGGVSMQEFLSLLTKTGFEGGTRTQLCFSPSTLNNLFDSQGSRKAPSEVRLGGFEPTSPKRGGIVFQTSPSDSDEGERELMESLRRECEDLGTGWRCVVGWVAKPLRGGRR